MGQLEHLWPCHSYHPAAVTTTGHGLPLRCARGDRWHVPEGQLECLCDSSVTELSTLVSLSPSTCGSGLGQWEEIQLLDQ